MDNRIALLEARQAKKNIPPIQPGDTLSVFVKVQEGGEDVRQEKGKRGKKEGAKEVKERIQKFEGTVIALHGSGLRQTVTVRKVTWGVGVERVFLLHSPKVDRVKVERHGKVRRAKLYYLRGRSARASRLGSTDRGLTRAAGTAAEAAPPVAAAPVEAPAISVTETAPPEQKPAS
ncbi:MAG: 50S ribosomal protein L19 [Candidatus Lindowbacteria bacterium RIFCSPLOWO2_12_FULL_62_27]|nr:MAG: 50S ribosomal protein L19 [Candidatus Lindowbacteria bacterium RIFCSPLOWO2_02_FULL_62_12]OGH62581.1 MAG: 50S ribosomal protein L19 [Candidatus Lindowbacteria bacterium RIFCSPLOWO2_12_FULL_62_27]